MTDLNQLIKPDQYLWSHRGYKTRDAAYMAILDDTVDGILSHADNPQLVHHGGRYYIALTDTNVSTYL